MRVTLADVEAAAHRIAGRVRRTPLMAALPVRADLPDGLLLKLESLQVTGSFKARGAVSKLTSLPPDAVAGGIVAASGGNHGVAVAYAGWSASVPTTVFVPTTVGALKAAKIESWGARLEIQGRLFDESNAAALAFAARTGATYFHPYADPAVIAGQGTVALEVLAETRAVDTFLIAVGGGGLISGMAVAAKALRPELRIIGVEPEGCPTLKASLDAGRVVRLERIDTIVPTMAAAATAPINLEICQALVDDVVLVSDEAMRAAATVLWLELGLAVDLSGAAAIAALTTGAYRPRPGERICALICGAGNDGF